MNKKTYLVVLMMLLLHTVSQASTIMSNDSCSQAFDIFCGTVLVADWTNATSDDVAVSNCVYSTSRRDVWYKMIGTGDIIKISLCNYSTEVYILGGSCNTLTCVDGVTDEYRYKCEENSDEKTFLSENGKEYYIYCRTLNPHLGSRLEVTCLEPAANNFCDGALVIQPEVSYTHSWHNTSPSGPSGDCYYDNYIRSDQWFYLLGTGERFVLSGDCSYYNIPYCVYKGSCGTLESINTFTVSNSTNAFDTDLGESYYIRIFGIYSDQLTFKLDISTPVENDSCHQAILVSLEDTTSYILEGATSEEEFCSGRNEFGIWYEFIGNDSVVTLVSIPSSYNRKSSIYKGSCDDLECIETTYANSTSLLTEKDSLYYLFYRSAHDEGQFHFVRNEEIHNNRPENASSLICSDSIVGSFIGATADFEFNSTTRPSVWYKITGTDEHYEFDSRMLVSNYSVLLQLFVNRNDTYERVYINEYPYYFLEQDSVYYINLYSTRDGDFYLNADCVSIVDNDTCLNAIAVNIDDTIIGQTDFSHIDSNQPCGYHSTNYNDVWYSFIGDGTLRDVTFNHDGQHRLSIYTGTCDQLICDESQFNRHYRLQPSTLRLYFEEGTTYYLKFFAVYNGFRGNSFTLSSVTVPIAANDQCSTATLLECGQEVVDSTGFAVMNELNCDGSEPYSGSIWYKIEGKGKYYFLEQMNGGETQFIDLSLELWVDDCENLICHNDVFINFNRRKVFWGEANTNYYIKVNSGYQTRPFSIRMGCIESLENDNYQNATPIICGSTYRSYAFDVSYEQLSSTCLYHNEGNDIWFQIEGNDEYLYVNDEPYYSSDNYHSDGIYRLQNGSLVCDQQFIEDRVFLERGVTYYVRFFYARSDYAVYSFDITFTCGTIVPFDDCASALEMNCGEEVSFDRLNANDDESGVECRRYTLGDRTVWFKVTGDNSWKNFHITDENDQLVDVQIWSYVGQCGALECLISDRAFYAEEGQEYFVSINGGYLGPTKVLMTCHESAHNGLCETAEALTLGDSISASVNYTRFCDSYFECSELGSRKETWYRISGTGSLVKLKLTSFAYNDHTMKIKVYEGECCGKKLVTNLYGNNMHTVIFDTKLEEEYLISISLGAVTDNGDYELVVSNEDSENINTCINAPLVLDNQTISINPIGATNFWPLDDFHYDNFVSWVYFMGSGGMDTLSLKSENTTSLHLSAFIDFTRDCGLHNNRLANIETIYSSSDSLVVVMPSKENEKYALAIEERHHYNSIVTNIDVHLSQEQNAIQDCILGFPSVINGQGKLLVYELLELNDLPGPFSIYIRDGGFSNYFNVHTDKTLAINFQNSGPKILEYSSSDCKGQICFDFIRGSCFENWEPPLLYVRLDQNGLGRLTEREILAGNFNGCRELETSLSQSEFTCSDVGEQTITLSVLEGCESFTIPVDIIVVDPLYPRMNCEDFEVVLDKKGNGVISQAEINERASDNCGIEQVQLEKTQFSCEDIGLQVVTLTATDINGTSLSCDVNVYVTEIGIDNVTIVGPLSVCPEMQNVPYTLVDPTVGLEYSWASEDSRLSINRNGSSEISVVFPSERTNISLQLSITSQCRFYENVGQIEVEMVDEEVCSIVSCMTDKLVLSEEEIDIIQAVDVFLANNEIVGDVQLRGDRVIVFRAGETIEFHYGFEIDRGTTFIGEITDCLSQLSNGF